MTVRKRENKIETRRDRKRKERTVRGERERGSERIIKRREKEREMNDFLTSLFEDFKRHYLCQFDISFLWATAATTTTTITV